MPHFEELYPGRFLKGVTLAAPKTIRIAAFVPEALEGDDGTKKQKAILKYKAKDGEGEMVCCKTNAALIAAMYGTDHSQWVGKLVTLHFDASVRFGSEKPGGIRVLGSPDLKQTMTVEIKRPRRKKPDIFVLQAMTGAMKTITPVATLEKTDPAGMKALSAEAVATLDKWKPYLAEVTDLSGLDQVEKNGYAAIPKELHADWQGLCAARYNVLRGNG